jgi:hypothetical protein
MKKRVVLSLRRDRAGFVNAGIVQFIQIRGLLVEFGIVVRRQGDVYHMRADYC